MTVSRGTENAKEEEEEFKIHDKIRYKLMRFSTIVSVFIFNWDPFLCYKKRSRKLRDRFYWLPELRMRPTCLDRLRKYWAKILFSLLTYIVIKYSILALAQTIICLSKRLFLANNSRSSFHSIVEIAHQTNQQLGNILESAGDIASFIFIYLTLTVLHSILYLSWSFNKYPMDALYFRLAISPVAEIRRIDLVIGEMLDSTEITVNTSIYYSLLGPNDYHLKNFIDSLYRRPIDSIRDELMNLVKIIGDLRASKASMRPDIYNIEFLRRMSDLVMLAIVFGCLIGHRWMSHFPFDLYRYSKMLTCEEKFKITNELLCQQLNPKSDADLIMFIEIFFAMFLVGYMIGMQTFQILANILVQLKSIHGMNEELDDCLITLKVANQPEYLIDHGLKSQIDAAHKQYYGLTDFDIDKKLLKTWIKLRITDDETQKNFSYVSRVFSVYMSMIIYCVALLLLEESSLPTSSPKDGSALVFYKYYLFLTEWGLLNVVSLACSASYTNAKQVEKKAWSVLAQMYIRACRLNMPFDRGFLTIHWIKLVRSRRLSTNGKTVKFLNMFGITYKTVLQVNVVLLSLYGILKRVV